MTRRLFVNGFPYHVTGEIPEIFFLAFGTVESVTATIDKKADRSHGFAFVEMSTEEALQKLDGTEVEGRTIKVHTAQPRLVYGRNTG